MCYNLFGKWGVLFMYHPEEENPIVLDVMAIFVWIGISIFTIGVVYYNFSSWFIITGIVIVLYSIYSIYFFIDDIIRKVTHRKNIDIDDLDKYWDDITKDLE